MARARVSAEEKEREQLLDKLRKVVDGQPRVLQGTAKVNAIFPGGAAGKKLADKAKQERYLESVPAPTPPKKGKAPEYARLTDEGRRFLVNHDPVVKLLGELQPIVKDLSGKVSSGASGPSEAGKGAGPEALVQNACDELRRSFQTMLDQAVRSLQESLLKAVREVKGEGSPAERLGNVLGTVQEALARAYPEATARAGGEDLSSAERGDEEVKTEQRSEQELVQRETKPIRDALLEGYDNLKWMSDYRDGLVELPHLLHEVRKKRPGLSVEEFHEELRGLWKAREVDLHILNEVASAKEPDQGIWQEGRLYYYVKWRSRP